MDLPYRLTHEEWLKAYDNEKTPVFLYRCIFSILLFFAFAGLTALFDIKPGFDNLILNFFLIILFFCISYLISGLFANFTKRLHNIEKFYGKSYIGYLNWYKREVIKIRYYYANIEILESEVEEAKTGDIPEEVSIFEAVGEIAAIFITAKLEADAERVSELERLREENPYEYRRVISLNPDEFKEYIEAKERQKAIYDVDAQVEIRKTGFEDAKADTLSKLTIQSRHKVEKEKIENPPPKKTQAEIQEEIEAVESRREKQVLEWRDELKKKGYEGDYLEEEIERKKRARGWLTSR